MCSAGLVHCQTLPSSSHKLPEVISSEEHAAIQPSVSLSDHMFHRMTGMADSVCCCRENMSSRLEKRSYKSRATFDPITPSQVMQPFTPLFTCNSYNMLPCSAALLCTPLLLLFGHVLVSILLCMGT